MAHSSPSSIPDKRIILKQSDQIVSRVPLPIFLDLIANLTLFCRLIKINCLHSRVQSLSNRHIPAPQVHLQSASKQMTRGEAGLRSPFTITQAVTLTQVRDIHNNIETHIIFRWQKQTCIFAAKDTAFHSMRGSAKFIRLIWCCYADEVNLWLFH